MAASETSSVEGFFGRPSVRRYLRTGTTIVDFANDFEDEPAYVVALASTQRGERLFAACTKGLIYELDVGSGDFGIVSRFAAHTHLITELAVHPSDERLLVSCSNDKSVKLWDVRSRPSRAAAEFTAEQEHAPQLALQASKKVTSCSAGGGAARTLLAASTTNSICVWDVRLPEHRRLGVLSPHSDHISMVKFHPHHTNLLYSSSFDGLICAHDVNNIKKREDCLASVIPIEEPVREFGFFGQQGSLLQCITSNHNASIWRLSSEERVVGWSDLRDTLTADLPGDVRVDYLLQFFAVGDQVVLLAGSHDGDVAAWRLVAGAADKSTPVLQPFTLMQAGHQATIRAAVWNTSTHIYTAGEDARITRWAFAARPPPPAQQQQRRVLASRDIEDSRHSLPRTPLHLPDRTRK